MGLRGGGGFGSYGALSMPPWSAGWGLRIFSPRAGFDRTEVSMPPIESLIMFEMSLGPPSSNSMPLISEMALQSGPSDACRGWGGAGEEVWGGKEVALQSGPSDAKRRLYVKGGAAARGAKRGGANGEGYKRRLHFAGAAVGGEGGCAGEREKR